MSRMWTLRRASRGHVASPKNFIEKKCWVQTTHGARTWVNHQRFRIFTILKYYMRIVQSGGQFGSEYYLSGPCTRWTTFTKNRCLQRPPPCGAKALLKVYFINEQKVVCAVGQTGLCRTSVRELLFTRVTTDRRVGLGNMPTIGSERWG